MTNSGKKKNALGVQYGYRTCICEHWKYNWIHLGMYNWTYREGLKLLVGVWINHLYIQQHIKKLREYVALSFFPHTLHSPMFVHFKIWVGSHETLCLA